MALCSCRACSLLISSCSICMRRLRGSRSAMLLKSMRNIRVGGLSPLQL
jgi:hypothetical protein